MTSRSVKEQAADVPLTSPGHQEPFADQRGTGVTKYSVAIGILGLLVAVVLAQNTRSTSVAILIFTFEAPLFAVVVVAALAITLLWELITSILRRRRRQIARDS